MPTIQIRTRGTVQQPTVENLLAEAMEQRGVRNVLITADHCNVNDAVQSADPIA